MGSVSARVQAVTLRADAFAADRKNKMLRYSAGLATFIALAEAMSTDARKAVVAKLIIPAEVRCWQSAALRRDWIDP